MPAKVMIGTLDGSVFMIKPDSCNKNVEIVTHVTS